jgi:four helix bundle protein
MPIRRVEDFGAFDFAGEFDTQVNELIKGSPQAQRAYKFREQLEDAADGIKRSMVEGFARRNPAEFATFLRYALGSLAEAVVAVRQGIGHGYFIEAQCECAFTWGKRCKSALEGLYASQILEAVTRRERRRQRPTPPRSRRRRR